MNWLTLQPTFDMRVPVRSKELMPAIRKAVQTDDLNLHAESAGACIDFKIPMEERRFWSPHLNVQVSDIPSGSELHCRYSPRPEVWTLFMAIYLVTSCFIFAAAIFAYVQWILDSQPWSLMFIPVLLLVILGLHFASLVGQGWSTDQMQDLRQRFDQTLKIALDNQTETSPRRSS